MSVKAGESVCPASNPPDGAPAPAHDGGRFRYRQRHRSGEGLAHDEIREQGAFLPEEFRDKGIPGASK